jgi:hypothetical protein
LRRIIEQAQPGDPLAVLVYDPGLDQRLLRIIRVDPR